MSEKQARRLRRNRAALGLPKFAAAQYTNDPDAAQNREDRRLVAHHRRKHAAELKATDPKERMAFIKKWNLVWTYLMAHPHFRPYLKKTKVDGTQQMRAEAHEARLELARMREEEQQPRDRPFQEEPN